MNKIPVIECGWHGRSPGIEVDFGVYMCPKCYARREKLAQLNDGEELELEQPPECACIGERVLVGTARISMKPANWAVLRWDACEDIRAGDSLVNVPVKDAKHKNNMIIRKACRPFKNPDVDMWRLFGIALEDTPKGGVVPVHLLGYIHEGVGDDYIEVKDAVLYKEVEDE